MILISLLIAQYKSVIDDIDDLMANSDSECAKKDPASGVSDCENLKAGEDSNKCCYVEWKYKEDGEQKTDRYCIAITKENYDDIGDITNSIEDASKEDNTEDELSIDCSSNYIILSIFSLFVIIIKLLLQVKLNYQEQYVSNILIIKFFFFHQLILIKKMKLIQL